MTSRAVVFDLDGTLAVPDRDHQTLLTEAADVADAPPLSRTEYLRAHREAVTGETRAPIFERLLDNGDPPAEAVARAYWEAVNDALEPVDGVESLVGDLTTDWATASAFSPTARREPSGANSTDWGGRTGSTPRW